MFSNSSHYCFRHSSFMFTASSESILMMRGSCSSVSPLWHYPHPTVHIKPCFLHEHLAQWQSVLQLHFTKDYKCIHNLWFHYVKQVHCWIWNYVRKEWHFAVDDVWSNLQGTYRWTVLVSTRQVEACSSRVIHTTEQELFPSTSMIFSFLMRVWLLGKHFRMVSEQRRFFQLLHWQVFSYREKGYL